MHGQPSTPEPQGSELTLDTKRSYPALVRAMVALQVLSLIRERLPRDSLTRRRHHEVSPGREATLQPMKLLWRPRLRQGVKGVGYVLVQREADQIDSLSVDATADLGGQDLDELLLGHAVGFRPRPRSAQAAAELPANSTGEPQNLVPFDRLGRALHGEHSACPGRRGLDL